MKIEDFFPDLKPVRVGNELFYPATEAVIALDYNDSNVPRTVAKLIPFHCRYKGFYGKIYTNAEGLLHLLLYSRSPEVTKRFLEYLLEHMKGDIDVNEVPLEKEYSKKIRALEEREKAALAAKEPKPPVIVNLKGNKKKRVDRTGMRKKEPEPLTHYPRDEDE